jgi:hypothetical protein
MSCVWFVEAEDHDSFSTVLSSISWRVTALAWSVPRCVSPVDGKSWVVGRECWCKWISKPVPRVGDGGVRRERVCTQGRVTERGYRVEGQPCVWQQPPFPDHLTDIWRRLLTHRHDSQNQDQGLKHGNLSWGQLNYASSPGRARTAPRKCNCKETLRIIHVCRLLQISEQSLSLEADSPLPSQ